MNLKLSLSHTFITLIMNIPLIRYSKIYFYIHVYINTLTTYSGYFNALQIWKQKTSHKEIHKIYHNLSMISTYMLEIADKFSLFKFIVQT